MRNREISSDNIRVMLPLGKLQRRDNSTLVSKEVRDCISFALHCSLIGSEIMCLPFNQSNV